MYEKEYIKINSDILSLIMFVELEGIEPSSIQGNNRLSTCLSLLKL